MKELNPKFHERKKVHSGNLISGVDSRFDKEKAKNRYHANKIFVENVPIEETSEKVVAVNSVVDIKELDQPIVSEISIEEEIQKPKRSRKQKEGINADDIDI